MSVTKLEVVTPQRRILTEEVESVIVPGTEGYLGVLPGHAPLLTSLKPGVVYYRRAGNTTQRLAVSGGFMEVGPDRVIILADTAERSSEIDVERARRTRARAEKHLRERPPGFDMDQAQEILQKSIARLKAADVE